MLCVLISEATSQPAMQLLSNGTGLVFISRGANPNVMLLACLLRSYPQMMMMMTTSQLLQQIPTAGPRHPTPRPW
jgi:hypothetical protein